MNKQKIVISSTHLDSHGDIMALSALESMLPFLNGSRKPRIGLEHIRTFPPYGVIMNGEIIKGNDDHYYLTAESCYFDKQEKIVLEDGIELIKESFAEINYPFVECQSEEVLKLHFLTDPTNFKDRNEVNEMAKIISTESGLDFEKSFLGRKSEFPDPEIIIKLTNTIALAIGIGATKIPQKIGEAIGDDLVKFYKLISTAAIETIKRTIPANRPKNFVIEFPNKKCVIELVISTHHADRVLDAVQKDKLRVINDKIILLNKLSPEKIQFIYSNEDKWEFNYLLTKNGEVIGVEKSFKARNEMYKDILKKQNDKKGNK